MPTPLTGDEANQLWLVYGGIMVEFMQAGFVLLEVGCLQKKNTRNVLVMSLVDDVMAALGWWAFGWGFAYGDGNAFIGHRDFFMAGGSFYDNTDSYNDLQYALWFFQYAFAATACTIVSGAVAERLKFSSYLVYAFFIPCLIYPVVCHWAWSSTGWASPFLTDMDNLLFGCGLLDFAGCTVIHLTGGVSALVAIYLTGPRRGRFDSDGKPNDISSWQQNPVYQCLGTFILWFGWYGFNCCSTGGLSGGAAGVAAKVAATTTIGAGGGCLSSLLTGYLLTGSVDVGFGNNGILAGLVAITAACATVEPWAACLIGAIGGQIYVGTSKLMLRFGLDDAVDAVAVHMANGIWGVIAAALFTSEVNYRRAYGGVVAHRESLGLDVHYGLFYGGGGHLLGAALCMILATMAWVGALVFIMFYTLDKFCGGIRVSADQEIDGLDISMHGGDAYPQDELPEKLRDEKEASLRSRAIAAPAV
jgi:Amt family ammonium transporter